jgi:PAS domain S-box-containing protein
VEVSSFGLWDFDLTTGEGYLTPGFCRFLGYSEQESPVTRRGGFDLIHPEDRESALRLLEAHIQGEIEEYQAEVRLRNKNGQYVRVVSRGKVISRDATGKALRIVGVHIDVGAMPVVGADPR